MDERLRQLEAGLAELGAEARRLRRRLRVVSAGAILALGAGLTLGLAAPVRSAGALQLPFVLVNKQGRIVLRIDETAQGVQLSISNARGTPVVSLNSNDGSGHLRLGAATGGIRARLCGTVEGGRLELLNKNSDPTARLQASGNFVNETGVPEFRLFMPGTEHAALLDSVSLFLSNGNPGGSVFAGILNNGDGRITLQDASGSQSFQAPP